MEPEDVFSFSFFGGKQLRKWGVFQQLWETTTEQHQRGKLAFEICCPSSQNKTRPLEVRGEEDKIRLPPVYSSGGVPGLGLGGLKLTVPEGCQFYYPV